MRNIRLLGAFIGFWMAGTGLLAWAHATAVTLISVLGCRHDLSCVLTTIKP